MMNVPLLEKTRSDHAMTEEATPAMLVKYEVERWRLTRGALRWFSLSYAAGTLATWATDYVLLGVSPVSLVLLGWRGAIALWLGVLFSVSWRPEAPSWLPAALRVTYLAVGSLLPFVTLLKPTNVPTQGGLAIVVILPMMLAAPLPRWQSSALGLLSTAAYLGAALWHHARSGYGAPNELIATGCVMASLSVLLPVIPQNEERRRRQDFLLHCKLERELALRNQHEAELREAAARVEQASRARGDFLANMSHELRTPMTAVLGLVELMLAEPCSEAQREGLSTIQQSGKALLRLLDDILDLSRLEEGKLNLHRAPTDITALCTAPVELLRPLAGRKGLSLSAALELASPCHVEADATRVQQVLLNLLGNAIKFTDQGSVVLRARRLPGDEPVPTFRFEIEDTGRGIAAPHQEQIFSRFARLEAPQQPVNGAGLGLAISRQLVLSMGGTIGLQSEEGRGSVFWFELPLPLTEPPEAPVVARDTPERELRVLLAEDNPVSARILTRMLQRLGQQPVLVEDGQAALDALQTGGFDLALLDMHMPKMNGEDVVREMRARPGDAGRVRIVALTADVIEENRSRYLAAGVDEIASKPTDIPTLQGILVRAAEALDRRAGG